jgi:ribosomal protein L32
MAVPKKRTSKSKKNIRKAHWKAQAGVEAKKALARAKTALQFSAPTLGAGGQVETSTSSIQGSQTELGTD